MKILQMNDGIPPAILGGSERMALETAKGLARRGHEVSILTAADASFFPPVLDGVRIETVSVLPLRFAHWRSVFSGKRAREVLQIINRLQPDVIHAHGLAWQLGYGWIKSARERHISVIYTAHGVMNVRYGKVTGNERWLAWQDLKKMKWQMNPFRNILIKRSLEACNGILCVSDALRSYLRQCGYGRMQTVRNGIDLKFWRAEETKVDARTALNLPTNAPIFLLAGRIGHDKGSSAVLSALPDSAHLLVAGTYDESAFRALGDRVHFFSQQSAVDMRRLYAACDAAVVPSVYLDPFPTVCLESMACSRPVIATSHGGAKEAVQDGKTGWIVDPKNMPALRERLRWCALHRDKLKTFGDDARSHMEQYFSMERYLDTLVDIYESCLKEPVAK